MRTDGTATDRRIAVLSFAVVGALLVPGAPADADGLRTTYGGRLEESQHRVSVRLDGRAARYTVTRTVHNPGERPEEVTLDVDLPTGAAVTGLALRRDVRWIAGRLLEAGEADAAYRRLTRAGEYHQRGPALLGWDEPGAVALRAYPVPAGGRITVRYTLEAPVCYANGRYIADYPVARAPGLDDPIVQVRGGRALDRAKAAAVLDVDDPMIGCDPHAARGGSARRYLVFRAPRVRPLAAAFARRAVDGAHALVRLDIDAAAVLEPAPRRAALVFVVDASRSVTDAQVAAQLEVVRAYLSHLPDARFDVVLVRRRAERLFGRLIPATRAGRALDALDPRRLERRNGSHLERGLTLAADALSEHRGPTRVIAFTDDRLRHAFEPAMATDALAPAPRKTLLHVALTGLAGGDYRFERADEHRLAPIAEATGGMAVWLNGGDGDRTQAAEAILGLVRPIRVDGFAVEVPGATAAALAVPETLEEGAAVHRTVVVGPGAGPAVVRGKIWGRRLERTLASDPRHAAALPTWLFGTDRWSQLPREALAGLARDGGAVSPATSYLARDPDAPATGWPYDPLLSGGVSSSHTCGAICGGVRGIGRGTVGRGRVVVDHAAVLRALLADRVHACFVAAGDAATPVDLAVETTGIEIVDVSVTGAAQPLATCLADAAWDTHLDDRFTAAHATYPVRFDPTP